jgi:hypothetical protein
MLAAGNDGQYGLYYASTASAGKDVTSVGSIDNSHSPEVLTEAEYTAGGETKSLGYTPAEGTTGTFAGVSLPVYADTFDTTVTNDFCNPITADLTGKIALIRRGTCTFVSKTQNAFNAGAKYVMFYNNAPGTLAASLAGSPITAAGMVDPATGQTWVKILAAGEELVLTFPEDIELFIISPGDPNTITGGYMSTYSTWNPSNENTIKPVVSAPGGSILSTWIASEGGYNVISGTSMATPFIAGVVALYLQAKGKGISPLVINAALASTAKPVNFNDGATTSPFLTSVAQQGGGLVDAYHMVHSGIALTETNLAFNDTADHVKSAAFYIQNTGTTVQTYTLTHAPAANFYSFPDDNNKYIVAAFPPPSDTKYSTAVISPATLSVKPGEKKRVTVSVTPDPSLQASLVPFYSGYINMTSSAGESVTLPYGGAATTMHDIVILQPDFNWPVFDTSLVSSTSSDGVNTFKPSAGSGPIYEWNNVWATAQMRLDIISVDGPNPVFVAGVATAGSVPGYPLSWVPRSAILGDYYGALWNGTLADGTVVGSGKYKFSLRLAKVFADLSRGREYERYDSEVFIMDMS